jgi:coproporphyrinogen III oxidase
MTAKTATLKSYKDPFLQFIYNLQDEICKALVSEDPDCMITEDVWERPEGGGGRSRAIGKGSVFENGGVNISTVHGQLPSSMMQYLETQHRNFFACGISLIIHPLNPFVPTVHANYRYFELYDADGLLIDQWFGGGSDITPYYLYKDDVAYFHKTNFEVCNRFDAILYPRFKKNCDEYFFNHHRGEARGAGGLFFDRLRGDESRDAEFWYAFVTSCGQAFVDSYLPIVRKRKSESYTDQHKFWQEIRRGRYVEFNLIHDKGTLFGLKTNGRVESILMSLPARVRWEYNYQPEPGSPEAELLEILKTPVNWI